MISIEGLSVVFKYFGQYLKNPNALEELRAQGLDWIMNFSNLACDLFHFIDQGPAIALATIGRVDIDILNVTRI